MKTGLRSRSAYIVLRCLEPLMKHEARVFDTAPKTIHTSLVIRGYCFSALISHEIMCLDNNQNEGNLLLFVVSHMRVKMTETFAANTVSHYPNRSLKTKNRSLNLMAE